MEIRGLYLPIVDTVKEKEKPKRAAKLGGHAQGHRTRGSKGQASGF